MDRNQEEFLEIGTDFNAKGTPEVIETSSTGYLQPDFNTLVERNPYIKYLQWPTADDALEDRSNKQMVMSSATATVSDPMNTWSFNPRPCQEIPSATKEDSFYQFEASSARQNNFAQEPYASNDSFKNCQPQPFLFDERKIRRVKSRYSLEVPHGNLQSSSGYNNWDRRLTSERCCCTTQAGNAFHSVPTLHKQLIRQPAAPSHNWQLQAPQTGQSHLGNGVKKDFEREMNQTSTKFYHNPSNTADTHSTDLKSDDHCESWARRMAASSVYNNNNPLQTPPGKHKHSSYFPMQRVNQVPSVGSKLMTREPASPIAYNDLTTLKNTGGVRENNWFGQRVDSRTTTRTKTDYFPSEALSANPCYLRSPSLQPCFDRASSQKWSLPNQSSDYSEAKTFDRRTGFKSSIPDVRRAVSFRNEKAGRKVEETQTSGEYSSTLFRAYAANRPAGSQGLSSLDEVEFGRQK
jgi:hypothetical protein